MPIRNRICWHPSLSVVLIPGQTYATLSIFFFLFIKFKLAKTENGPRDLTKGPTMLLNV
jgi:hypothetical protein